MNEPSTIEAPIAVAGRPPFDEYGVDDDRYLDGPPVCDLIEDRTDVPSLAFFPTMVRPSGKIAIAPARLRAALIAAGISLIAHVSLSLGVYCVMRSLHVFVAAHPQAVQGDGATALGAIDHDGDDQAPGAAGPGSLTSGWSAPPQSGVARALDDPLALDTSDAPPPPASAPPPTGPPEPVDDHPAPAPVAADVIVNPLQPDLLPVFTRSPPVLPGAPPSPATAPADRAAAATQPAAPVELATTRPAASTTAPSPPATADGKQSVGNEAIAAGFASPASDKTGGLLHHGGAGGSNGKGGATTGDRGTAVTGHPGSLAGVKGRPLHADYPDDCQRRGESGRVVIEADIRADGSIASLKVISDEGHPQLAQAALDAFEGRTFTPALLDGRPIRSTLRCPFVFELREKREGHE